MATGSELREKIKEELEEYVEKRQQKIKELRDTISAEMICKASVQGGALATAARNACDSRADAARRQISALESEISWRQEMLSKYC